MSYLKTQLHIFLTAVMFYTRIPCPKWVDHSEDYLNRATVYFPVIGWLVGGVSALVYLTLFSTLGHSTSEFGFSVRYSFLPVIGSMLTSILMTGAFHEDGLADVCDGFGGGWTKVRILEIMKDSRVGTYGVIGLIGILLLKAVLIQEIVLELLNRPHIWERYFWGVINWGFMTHMGFTFLIAHSLSRFTALTFIFTHSYVRENEDSKAKPVAKRLSRGRLLTAFLLAVVPLVVYSWLMHRWFLVGVFVPLALVKWYLGRYFQRWIGGYTGDCLGATQQVAEVIVYLFLAVAWKYI